VNRCTLPWNNAGKRVSFKRFGKPEPLKHALQGWWSPASQAEHRLVYRVSGKGGDQQSISSMPLSLLR
jgi:Txe/YoeB family toxin of Txe-Axe toxin-antitoxin module